MPIIDLPLERLLSAINAGAGSAAISEQDLARRLPLMGCAIEDFAVTRQYQCRMCEKATDRTAAQGALLICSQCGVDYRASPDALIDRGENKVVRFELLAVRPDIFDIGGMSRFVRGVLGVRTGLIEYPLSRPKLRVRVDARLSDERSYRPFISCAVLRNTRFDDERIKVLMNLQEDLHWALGRNRKLASIGVYDLDTLVGDAFTYDAVAPDGVRFVPLGFDPARPNAALTPAQVLENHKTGQAFAHLLRPLAAYPLLRDAAGTVLSMPPIINSESTRVTRNSRNLFVDVTGLSLRTVDRALNVLVTSLKEVMPELEIEAVTIDSPAGVRITPALQPTEMRLDVRQACETIGVDLTPGALAELLERMGFGVALDGSAGEAAPPGARGDAKRPPGGAETDPACATPALSTHDASRSEVSLRVRVPAYRNDVMHPIDLIEDAAVAYGYENLHPRLVPTFSVGAPRDIEERGAVARRIMTGLGFHQVMTLTLSSEAAAFDAWGTPHDPRAVRIENPISVEQTICRVSLLPGLMQTLAINKQYDLPQHIFEVGDVSYCDSSQETGAREERYMAAAMIGTHVGYADIRAVSDAFSHELAAELSVQPLEHPSFISGRAASLRDRRGRTIGLMGELHPRVLENYGLRHAVSVLELSLAKLLGLE